MMKMERYIILQEIQQITGSSLEKKMEVIYIGELSELMEMEVFE